MNRLRCRLEKFFRNREDKELIILFILGFICLIEICFSVYFPAEESKQIDTAIRSQLITIFGYIFGAQGMPNNNISNKNLQFFIASIVAFACLFFLIFARWINGMSSSVEGIVVMRDLMVSATAFIIGIISSKN